VQDFLHSDGHMNNRKYTADIDWRD